MDHFAESHRERHRGHLRQSRFSPYRKAQASPHSVNAFAPSPSPLRSHARRYGRVKPDVNIHNKEDVTFVNESLHEQPEPESDDSTFHWDESATLLSDLMDEKTQDSEDEELELLAESLQAPFSAQGHRKKEEIAEVLVGTHNNVRKVFELLDENVDVHYGKGAHLYKTASIAIEETFFAQQIAIQEAYDATESKIEALLGELEEDFAVRDRLWLDLENQIKELLVPVIDRIKDTPTQVECTIAKLEKHSKTLEFSGKEATASARRILDEIMKKSE